MVRLVLPDMTERERTQMEIAADITRGVRNETAARAFRQQQSTFGGRRVCPRQYVLQAPNIEKLQEFIPIAHGEGKPEPLLPDGRRGSEIHKPETRIIIDRGCCFHAWCQHTLSDRHLQYALSGQRCGLLLYEWKTVPDSGRDKTGNNEIPLST